MPRKPSVKKPAKPAGPVAFKTPRAVCPISGDELQYVPINTLAAGHPIQRWQVRGSGWVSTILFNSRAEAEWFFSHNEGVPPAFKSPHAKVEVVGVREAPDTVGQEVESAIKDAQSFGGYAAEELSK